MRSLLMVFALLCFACGTEPATSETTQGSCGSVVPWSFEDPQQWCTMPVITQFQLAKWIAQTACTEVGGPCYQTVLCGFCGPDGQGCNAYLNPLKCSTYWSCVDNTSYDDIDARCWQMFQE